MELNEDGQGVRDFKELREPWFELSPSIGEVSTSTGCFEGEVHFINLERVDKTNPDPRTYADILCTDDVAVTFQEMQSALSDHYRRLNNSNNSNQGSTPDGEQNQNKLYRIWPDYHPMNPSQGNGGAAGGPASGGNF